VPYSPWQLLEHLRITQHDILEFCRKPDYEELEWPKDYWPASAAPPSASAWDDAVAVYLKERGELQALAVDKALDLHARIPHGSGQTYARRSAGARAAPARHLEGGLTGESVHDLVGNVLPFEVRDLE
jgi:hypothetical protein